ncbi:MAG: type IV pilin protein [Lysobacter sp.]|nr:type IV pilin protein [Lysobacter sp.]
MTSHRPRTSVSSRRVHGFTLVEMVIVVLIISVLAAIAYPAYQNHVIKTRREAAKACLMEMQQFMERFYTTNLRYDQTVPGGAAVALPPCQAGTDVTNHYQVALDGAPTRTTYRLRAVPQGRQATVDTYCGTMSINNQGGKAVTGSQTVDYCW